MSIFDCVLEWEIDEFIFNPVWYQHAILLGFDLSNDIGGECS